MSQKPQPGQQGNLSDALREGPDHNAAQDEAAGPLPRPNRISVQEPQSILHTRPVSVLETPPVSHARRVSIQEPLPISYARRVSVREPLPVSYARRVSVQEPLPVVYGRRVSVQEPPPTVYGRRVSVQEPPPTVDTRRVSVQESPALALALALARRVSTQEPAPTLHPRRASVQEPAPMDGGVRDSIREAPAIGNIIRKSTPSVASSVNSTQQSSTQDAPWTPPTPVTYGSCVDTQPAPSLQLWGPSVPRPLAMPNSLLASFDSAAYGSQNIQDALAVPPSQGLKSLNRASVDVPPSITNSPVPRISAVGRVGPEERAGWSTKGGP